MATRLSLIRSLRQKEERQQLGKFIPTAVRNLKSIEKCCLLGLSQAARVAGQTQIALNSVIRAQQLDDRPSSEVSEEFANVLWLQKEEPLAVRYLKVLVDNDDAGTDVPVDRSRKAIWLSRLGTWAAEACIEKPSEISTKYFDRSIALLENIKNDGLYDASLATIYRECAMFAERQYYSISRSPDALRWKVYVDRKRQEIELREKDIGSQTDSHRKERLKHEQTKARRLLTEDSELFGKHNVLRNSFLKQAIEMHSRCLEASDSFDNDSVTRFCSLWFATFDDDSISNAVKVGLSRIPSRKLIMLAVRMCWQY
jgi:ataxia telangiectasia mutated family protein